MNDSAPIVDGQPAASLEGVGASPMIAQYIEIKTANPDCLLFYRMGDFYELFFDDAVTAARALGITLTKRGRHRGEDIPMCGVPVHSADDYLQRLIRLGHRVAVCEQLEDPAEARKRGSKSVVKRDVVRLVTAGTLTEDALLNARRNNYLAAVARVRGAAGGEPACAIAWLDISTGAFHVSACDMTGLGAEIARIDPGEIIVPETLHEEDGLKPLWREARCAVTPLPRSFFDSASAEARLRDYFSVAALDAFGAFSRAELAACGALLGYVDLTQVGHKPAISPPRAEARGGVMHIDAATRANLELVRTTRGEHEASLLAAIDRTVTAPGARELADRLASPLTDPDRINARFDAVACLVEDAALRADLRARLRAAPDIARALSRLALGRGGPRDLGALRAGLEACADIRGLLEGHGGLPEEIARASAALGTPGKDLAQALDAALGDDLPVLTRDGGFVRAGHHQALDEARTLRDESRRVIAGLQARYADDSGIRSLKIRHNNVLGYFVDVTAQHGGKLMAEPLKGTFIHRQTLANAMRFTTVELGELEARIAAAGERALAIEIEVFERLRAMALDQAEEVKAAAAALAVLDVHTALAELAAADNYARPRVDSSLAFEVTAGRHPVVERALKADGAPFVANDCDLGPGDAEDGASLWLVTGPNMAGKSTFLRQNALIAVLAQMGSFVPARKAHIGVVDRLFSRVGASDDLARGRSTFMVEMVETAAILNQAGPRALVILDEIGRGTATFDGLSIAWAAVEHLHEVNRCRTLFATHFHELTSLQQRLARLRTATMSVKEWGGDVVFLHEVRPGAADRSYGIQVAKLAGLPAAVVARARDVLAMLEQGEQARAGARLIDDLPLFSAAPRAAQSAARADPAVEALRGLVAEAAPDDMTPREALELIYRLKQALGEAG